MRANNRMWRSVALLSVLLIAISLCPLTIFGQSTFTSQLTGVVTDSTGAVIPGAKVTLTDEATAVANTATTDKRGIYVFTGIRPATYTIRVESAGMAPRERKGVVLAVNQEATVDFTMSPGAISESVTVTSQAPLLDTANASLGTDVTNEYVRDIPLPDRSFFGLVFLSGGVTETAGQGTEDSYPSGTNFVSNGQRNATAEIRLDGGLTTAPEQGEGATTNVYYQPSVEIVQEFKVENNSFSAEYGNNGGTVVNIVSKEGGNKFHGSGWWFGQRSALDANSYFNNAFGTPRPDHLRDQAGFSLGGPIKKGKTFFFADLEWYRQNNPSATDAIVPTDLERKGDFRQTFLPCNDPSQCTVGQPFQQHIFNPFNVDINGNRQDFATPNVIDSGLIDPIGQAIINLYPKPTLLNAAPGNPNYHSVVIQRDTNWQGDIKIDHHFSEKNHISGRYSNLRNSFTSPFTNLDLFNGQTAPTHVHNAVLEENWSPKTTLLWTNRVALDRVWSPVQENYPKLNTIFNAPGDTILSSINGLSRLPVINMENDASTLLPQCCTDTTFAHTLVSYNSLLSWVRGRHVWKFGGEQRIFFNNFYQPNPPTGNFSFTQTVTEQVVNGGNAQQGDSYASLLLGYGDPNGDSNVSGSSLSTFKPVENKSKETAFFFQDDWKVSSKLTLNLGLRYEWSTPYTERNNLIQFSNFTGDSGIAVPINVVDPNSLAAGAVIPTPLLLNRTGDLPGTTEFPTSGRRNSPVDRNNVAPRFGFAYALDSKTVFRGGAGVYYGLNPATNFQFTGTAFGNSHAIRFTKDNFQTPFATLETPFPDAVGTPGTIAYAPPQANKYGADAMWGFSNGNSLDTGTVRNAEIYQWNVGVQHLFPGGITIGVDYSASRSTHLPFSSQSGAAEHNFLPSTIRNQIVANSNACFATATNPGTDCMTPTNVLATLVTNPFQCFFTTNLPGPAPAYCPASPIFNEPESRYNDDQIPLGNLLNPFPQFDGSFSGLALLTASSRYNSVQVRFQKRPSHYVSFEGNYTYSKAMDDSSAGANSFITNSLGAGGVQVLDNHKAEWSISANDATHRLVLATIVDLPVGRGRWIGRDMNRIVDAVAGGWAVSTILTFQSGTPINIVLDSPLFANGSQRPNVTCSHPSSGISYHDAAANGVKLSLGQNVDPQSASVFNENCFAFPGDNVPGNAPRYFSNLRGDGIHNSDLSFSKEFTIRENQKLQFRAEFFNFTNTPRFDFPHTNFGGGSFGQTDNQLNNPRHMQFGARFEF